MPEGTSQRRMAVASVAALAAIVLVAVLSYAVGASRHRAIASQGAPGLKAAVGERAPEFAVPTTAGLFDLKGARKPVFLEVFATWCPHCQRETAVIDRLFDTYRAHVAFVGVSGSDTAIDGTSAASALDVINWAARFGARYPIAYDSSLNVARDYLQGGFPTLVVIDKHKHVTYINSGEVSYDELSAAIEKSLY